PTMRTNRVLGLLGRRGGVARFVFSVTDGLFSVTAGLFVTGFAAFSVTGLMLDGLPRGSLALASNRASRMARRASSRLILAPLPSESPPAWALHPVAGAGIR